MSNDENVLVFPPAWRKAFIPRRGGEPGPPLPLDEAKIAARVARVAAASFNASRILAEPDTDPELSAAAHAYQSGEVTALGAAAVAATIALPGRRSTEDHAAIGDEWVLRGGVLFAATAAAELAGLSIFATSTQPLHLRRWTAQQDHGLPTFPVEPEVVSRVRAHLAVSSAADYAAAVAILATYRGAFMRIRLLTSFLVPTEVRWVDEDCAAVAAVGGWGAGSLPGAVSSLAHLAVIGDAIPVWSISRSLRELVTLVDGVGVEVAPLLAAWLDSAQAGADARRLLLSVIGALPTDQAMSLMIERLGQSYVQPALMESVARFPVRATRLLAEVAVGGSEVATRAAAVLRTQVVRFGTAVDAALPTVGPAAAAAIRAIREDGHSVPEAAPESLPRVLVDPPWLRSTKPPKPVVIAGLEPPAGVEVEWLPGERERWASKRGAWNPWFSGRWAEAVALYTSGKFDRYSCPPLFALGPEELVRPLVRAWCATGPTTWEVGDWLPALAARFELDVSALVVDLARTNPPSWASFLLPFASAEIAALIADWHARLRSVRGVATAWLARHPSYAARALVPAALGKPGPARRAAEGALRHIAEKVPDGRATVTDAAHSCGGAAAAAVVALLDTDPLDALPATMPAVPPWAEPGLLPPVLTRDRTSVLPLAAAGHVVTMLALTRSGAAYAGLDAVKAVTDPRSLAACGEALFEAWLGVGAPTKEAWAFDALGLVGDDDTVRRLTPLIRAWPGEAAHARAVAGLDVLATIGTDVALLHLYSISEKVKFKALKDRAGERIADVAADLGLTPDQLGDRLVPDLGLDDDGSLSLDFGPRRFTVGFDEQLRPTVTDESGAKRRDLPKPGARDDQSLAPAAWARFAALKKDARAVASDQVHRLERAMVRRRTWSADEFDRLLVRHPLVVHLSRRLVWAAEAGSTAATFFRVAEDRTLADGADAAFTVPSDSAVRVAHPLDLGDALSDWATLFGDYEILQPFPQLGREVFRLTDEERAALEVTRFVGATVSTFKILGLEKRGWRRGPALDNGVQEWITFPLDDDLVIVIDFEPGIAVGLPDVLPEQRLGTLSITDRPDDYRHAQPLVQSFGELDPVTASEILRDVTELTR